MTKTKNIATSLLAISLVVLMILFSIVPSFAINPKGDKSAEIFVSDEDGSPLRGIKLSITDSQGSTARFISGSNNEFILQDGGHYKVVESNSSGKIILDGLEDKSYTISYSGNNSDYVLTEKVTFKAGVNEYVNVEMARNIGNFSVSVLGEEGEVVPNAKFTVNDENGTSLNFSYASGVYSYSSNGSETIQTNKAGKIMVYNMPVGDYVLIQKSGPEEYNGPLLSKEFSISLKSQEKITLTTEKRYGNAVIKLTDGSSTINGGTFVITDSSNKQISFTNGKYVRTGGSSTIKVDSSVTLTGIPVGTYTVSQSDVANGHIKSGNVSLDIKKNKTSTIQIINPMDVGALNVSVSNSTTKEAVSDYVFELLDSRGNVLSFIRGSDGNYSYSSDGSETVLTSNMNGVIVVKSLPSATYTLKPKKAAPGYVFNTTETKCKIEYNKTATAKFEVLRTSTSIEIKDADGKPVKNLTLEVLDKEKSIYSAKTNDSGKFSISGIAPGTYTLSVKGVPAPYLNKKYSQEFTIASNGKISKLNPIIIEFNKVTVDIGQKVSGAKFALLNVIDNNKTLYAESDENGIVVFDKIDDGLYTLKQLEEVDGYLKSDQEISITIDRKTTEQKTYDFKNTVKDGSTQQGSENGASEPESILPIAPSGKEQKTSFPIIILIIVLVLVIGAAVFVAVLLKKTDKENKDNQDSKNNQEETRDSLKNKRKPTIALSDQSFENKDVDLSAETREIVLPSSIKKETTDLVAETDNSDNMEEELPFIMDVDIPEDDSEQIIGKRFKDEEKEGNSEEIIKTEQEQDQPVDQFDFSTSAVFDDLPFLDDNENAIPPTHRDAETQELFNTLSRLENFDIEQDSNSKNPKKHGKNSSKN